MSLDPFAGVRAEIPRRLRSLGTLLGAALDVAPLLVGKNEHFGTAQWKVRKRLLRHGLVKVPPPKGDRVEVQKELQALVAAKRITCDPYWLEYTGMLRPARQGPHTLLRLPPAYCGLLQIRHLTDASYGSEIADFVAATTLHERIDGQVIILPNSCRNDGPPHTWPVACFKDGHLWFLPADKFLTTELILVEGDLNEAEQ